MTGDRLSMSDEGLPTLLRRLEGATTVAAFATTSLLRMSLKSDGFVSRR